MQRRQNKKEKEAEEEEKKRYKRLTDAKDQLQKDFEQKLETQNSLMKSIKPMNSEKVLEK